MSDRPVLFSAPMVRALLDDRKQQTRRIINPQPTMHDAGDCTISGNRGPVDYLMREIYPQYMARFRKGDRLYVRETFSGPADQATMSPGEWASGEPIWYWADGNPTEGDWTKPKPGIHMPRWASRLTLTVTDVRVQRLQECSATDAIAEGIAVGAPIPLVPDSRGNIYHDGVTDPIDGWTRNPVTAYANLWNHINGDGAWSANPWIVALTFTVEKRNIDAIPVRYLIWSNFHGAWWGPNHAGYFTELASAGRYTREEAIKQCAYGRDGFTTKRIPPELPVREIDAINRGCRSINDLVLKADRAECRALDLASKARLRA